MYFCRQSDDRLRQGRWFELPTFVWALGTGVIVRNGLEHVLKVDISRHMQSMFIFGQWPLL